MIKGWAVTTSAVKASIAYYSRVAGQAERYYREQQDHPLGEDQEVGESVTLLHGAPEVLSALELEAGEVDTRVVTALAIGVHPETGTTLVRARPGVDPSTGEPWARRCYYDFALSVPQSYSTAFAAALAAGDGPTADAMRQDVIDAAVAAYSAMEDCVQLGRRGRAGAVKVTAHAPLLANLHSTSRPVRGRTHGDPTLHVHLRVMNMGLGSDGAWSAIDYRPLWAGVRTWSALFEADLQSRVLRRGGETALVERGDRKPWMSWELAGRSPALDEAFSSRSTIVARVESRLWQRNADELLVRLRADDLRGGEAPRDGLTARQWDAVRPTAKQIDAEVRRTRERKAPVSRAELLEEWRGRIAEHGFRHSPYDGVDRRFGISRRAPERAREVLRRRGREMALEQLVADLLAPAGLTAGRAVWTRAELAEAVSGGLVGAQLGVEDAQEVMRRVEARAVAAPPTPTGQRVWTTHELLAEERTWTRYLTRLAGAPRLRIPGSAVDAAIEGAARRARRGGRGGGLDAEQQAAVRTALDGHGFTAIVGDAGSGKTTTARVVVEALRAAGYTPVGLAVAGSASEVLRGEAGVAGWNVRDFLTRYEHGLLGDQMGRRTVVLLDEAGTVDDRTLAELTRALRSAKVAGVIALGDDRQAQPVGAGAPLRWLRRALPNRVCRLTVNYRQGQNRGESRGDRALLLRRGDAKAYLEAVDRSGQLVVARTTDEAIAALTGRWRDAIAGGGDVRTHVGLCNLNDSRDQLNEAFRAAYAQLGRLGEEVTLPGGRPMAVGDRVAFNAPFRELALDARGDPIPCRTRRGRLIPGRYEMTKQRAANRTQGTVVGFERGAVVVAIDASGDRAGVTLRVRASGAGVLDHAYCRSTNIGQGATLAATYSLADTSRITGAANSYVQATRESQFHWLAVSAEAARVDPLSEGWRAATISAAAAAMSRAPQARCALEYFEGAEADGVSDDEVDRLEERLRDRAMRVLMAPATVELLAAAAAAGRSLEETATWTVLRAEAEAEAGAGVAPGTAARGRLAAAYGEERARRWVAEAIRACGAPSAGAAAAPEIARSPVDVALAALALPATRYQLAELDEAGRSPRPESAPWSWARASVELDIARDAVFPGRRVVEFLTANGVSPARAALEVNRILADHGLRLEPEQMPAAGGRPYFRVVTADPADEHLLRIERLLHTPPGARRLDAAFEYTQWLRQRAAPVDRETAGALQLAGRAVAIGGAGSVQATSALGPRPTAAAAEEQLADERRRAEIDGAEAERRQREQDGPSMRGG